MMLFSVFLCSLACVLGKDINVPTSIEQSNPDFSIDLYQELAKSIGDNDLIYSAYSLESILALISLGAKGNTATQIKSALKLNISDEQIKNDFKSMSELLKHVEGLNIDTANRAYLAKDLKIKSEYLEVATEYFNAGVENVDFTKAKKTAEDINSWVEKQTHDKIKNLIKESQLNELTRFILVNALYFRGDWLYPFKEDKTEKLDFHKSKTETVQVDTMKLKHLLPIQRNPTLGVSILQLPYMNKRVAFYIVLPDKIDGLADAEKNLAEIHKQVNLTTDFVEVFLPKFRVESTNDMIPILKNLGITSLFSKADLSGIVQEDNIFVSSILQKTYIEINEWGTEAASATAAEAEARQLPFERDNAQIFRVDHPFIFTIEYDGVDLLSGRITSP